MKKQLLMVAIAAGVMGSASASFISELSTDVKNVGDRDIWVTWKSATTVGKILSGPRTLVRKDRYARIEPKKSLSMWHTGDQLKAISYKCEGNRIVPIVAEQKATTKGYQKAEIEVVGNQINIRISE